MQPTPDFDPSRLARSLLRRSRQGALATLAAGSGDPYCSLVNVASHADASPILLISRLALHTKNILGDGRVSLMLDEIAVLGEHRPHVAAWAGRRWRSRRSLERSANVHEGRRVNLGAQL